MYLVFHTKLNSEKLFGVTSTGSFLIALAVDLLLHTTTALSVGLRILFDGNSSHTDVSAITLAERIIS